MPDQPTLGANVAVAFELFLAALGLLLAWRFVFNADARAHRGPSPLPTWDLKLFELVLFLLHALFGGVAGGLVVSLVAKPLGIVGDNLIIFSNAMAQLGLLGGVGLFTLSYRGRLQVAIGAPREVFVGGFATFLISVPFVLLGGLLWTGGMKLVGLPLEKQLSVDLFGRTASLAWRAVLGITAVGIAPIAEELIFRAGLFRFCRTRLPAWAALLLPACVFAALHNNLPTFAQLAILGIVFSLAYQRTGKLGVAIVAHALFNLHEVVLLVAGVSN